MLNSDFAKKFINIAQNVKTLYVLGGWGEPLTDYWKNYFITHYKDNKEKWADDILAASADTFAFDCVCLVKSVLDGFSADATKTYGGATYGKPCPDITISSLLNDYCVDISSNLSNILIGEFIVTENYGHCGVYVGIINGKRMVAECTYSKSHNGYSGVQLIDMDSPARTTGSTVWKYHGKLWQWMDYKYKEASLFQNPTPTPNPAPINTILLKTVVNARVKAKKGDRGAYIKEIQKVLIARGFSCGTSGADGIFGSGTETAVRNFQTANKLTVTGIVDLDTINKLIS